MSLLGACRTKEQVELAEKISNQILKNYFDEDIRASTYLAMANLYAKSRNV